VKELVVDLSISAEEYTKLYAGLAQHVSARCRDGRRVRFPANILQPFVSRSGISGSFLIQFDEHNKFKGIKKLSFA